MSRRRVVIHADDLGMSHGANAAFAELSALGTCSAGSAMVPCPWFADIAARARADASLDIGVHLTLTSEMPGYRWRPLTRPPASSGLTDDQGFFHRDTATVRMRADREAVRAELEAQIDAALDAGIDVTHLDDHMGAVLAPEFVDVAVEIACQRSLPLLLCPSLLDYGGTHNLIGADNSVFRRAVARAVSLGQPVFDRIVETDWDRSESVGPAYQVIFDRLGEGVSFLALHFAIPGEIENIDPVGHQIRTDEYALFESAAFRDFLAGTGIEICGMREYRDGMRQQGELTVT